MNQVEWLAEEQPASSGAPSLYHYTGLAALQGMIENREIWATHFSSLNDPTEVHFAREQITEAVRPMMLDLLMKAVWDTPSAKQRIDESGGAIKLAGLEANALVDSIFNPAFVGVAGKTPLSPAFIASFCSHEKQSSYVRKNGLLSQWRAYGKNGVCIVFNTKRLEELLAREERRCAYGLLTLRNVFYDKKTFAASPAFVELIERLRVTHNKMLNAVGGPAPSGMITGELIELFLNACTRLKHEGFVEEGEVRIIALPKARRMWEMADADEGGETRGGEYLVEPFERDGSMRIALNRTHPNTPLPIERIIVAPSAHQAELVSSVKGIIGDKCIPVHASETPFIEKTDKSVR